MSYFVLILYNLLKLINFKEKVKFLDFTDKYSYHLYLTHQIFILGPLSVLSLTASKPLNIVLSLIFIALLTFVMILLSNLFKKSFKKF